VSPHLNKLQLKAQAAAGAVAGAVADKIAKKKGNCANGTAAAKEEQVRAELEESGMEGGSSVGRGEGKGLLGFHAAEGFG
jgi:hypothetical protein